MLLDRVPGQLFEALVGRADRQGCLCARDPPVCASSVLRWVMNDTLA
ncbi:MAG: hypothetical protein ACE5MG_09250 [Candidatus Methylomirabilales bacterium]